MNDEVKLIGLKTGQDLLCKVNESINNMVRLTDVYVVGMSQQELALVPFPMLAEKNEVIISNDNILYGPVKPEQKIVEAYQQQISNIVMPSVGLKLPS